MPKSAHLDDEVSPVRQLTERALSRRVTAIQPLAAREHWSSAGALEQSTLTGEARTRFQVDDAWNCTECRVFKEEREGRRLLEAFLGREMWLTIVDGSISDRIKRWAERSDVAYARVPIRGGFAVLTTGELVAPAERRIVSEQVRGQELFVRQALMKVRWLGSISSSRGFLPPARTPTAWEAYAKKTGARCWHRHCSEDEARTCSRKKSSEDPDATRWYVRNVSEWRKVGRLAVFGEPLRRLADQLHIKTSARSSGAVLEFEPMMWEDPRFQRLRELARWTPPHPGFQPPDLAVQIRVSSVGSASA